MKRNEPIKQFPFSLVFKLENIDIGEARTQEIKAIGEVHITETISTGIGYIYTGSKIISNLSDRTIVGHRTPDMAAYSVSTVIWWWHSRSQDMLGRPKPTQNPRFSFGLAALNVILSPDLPLFSASVIFVKIIERWLLRRISAVSDSLGLSIAEG